MRKVHILLILVSIFGIAHDGCSQIATISLDKMNVVYLGLPNPCIIAGDGLTEDNLVVKIIQTYINFHIPLK